MALLLRNVDFLASGTKHFNPGGSDFLAHSYRQNILSFAEHPGTYSKHAFDKLFAHESLPLGSGYEPGVDEAIDISGLLVD